MLTPHRSCTILLVAGCDFVNMLVMRTAAPLNSSIFQLQHMTMQRGTIFFEGYNCILKYHREMIL